MSEKNSPESEKPQRPIGGTVKMAMLAGLLGLAVGGGLYAFSGQIGNDESTGKIAEGESSCVVDETLAAKLNAGSSGDMAAFKALDRPASVADLAFKDKDGTGYRLADWHGKTVLFNLWATWCAPCRAEMPTLDALQAELGGDQFEVVAVSVDLGTPEKPKKFYSDIGMKSARFFHDGELATLNSLKRTGLAFGLPATLLVNGKGCVLGALNGPAEWAGEDAKALLRSAFKPAS